MQLTEIERALLRIMQRDARTTLSDLADRVGVSPSSVQRRLQGLRERHVILRDVSILDAKKAGPSITFLVDLELERDRPELLPSLYDWIRRTAAVQQAWCLTGHSDYTLVVVVQSVDEFDLLSEEMMISNPNIRKFTTSVALKSIKRTLEIPL